MKPLCRSSVGLGFAAFALLACAEPAPSASGPFDAGSNPSDSRPDPSDLPDAAPLDAESSDAEASDAELTDFADARPEPAPDAAPDEDACSGDYPCIEAFPHRVEADTEGPSTSMFDAYACKADADESGPEQIYEVIVPEAGFLSAAVYDDAGVDIDLHLLGSLDATDCLVRGHHQLGVDVEPGRYYLVADSFVGDAVLSGPYTLEVGLYIPSRGACEMEVGEMPRVRDGGDHLAMPATGPMVLEAHLVTAEEPAPFPMSPREELAEHYVLSQDRTGFVMHRQQAWAPLEGGSFYGAGIGPARLLPVEDEGWYVNMYWTRDARPDRGARMILRDPDGDRAVVVAAGHETGPGNLDHIGGTPEESHFYLGTGHRSVLTLGIAVDQALPLGPRICE